MTGEERLAAFEAMLDSVQKQYAETTARMDKMKLEGKVKTATYRQLFARKLSLQDVLTLYQVYGLLTKDEVGK